MDLLKIAYKNLIRSKKRALRTIGILAMGIVVFVFYGTLMDGFSQMSIDATIDEDTAHIQIRKNGFDEDFLYSNDNFFKVSTTKLDSLENIYYTPSIRMNGEVDNHEDSFPVILMGVDYKTAKDVFTINSTSEEALGDGAWLAGTIAKNMGLKIGDYINITFRNSQGSFISAEYEITGFLNSSNPLFSSQSVMIDLTELQSMLGTDEVSFYSIFVEHQSEIDDVTANIREIYSDADVLDLDALTSEMLSMMQAKDAIMIPFFFIIGLITFLGLANSILISVWEKRKNMGTLRALGYFDREIISIFLFEGFLIGLLGTLIGLAIGALINIPLSTFGFDLTSLASMGNGENMFDSISFYMPPVMKSTWNLSYFIGPLAIVPLLSMLISYIPAKKSVKMSIVDCIRNKE